MILVTKCIRSGQYKMNLFGTNFTKNFEVYHKNCFSSTFNKYMKGMIYFSVVISFLVLQLGGRLLFLTFVPLQYKCKMLLSRSLH